MIKIGDIMDKSLLLEMMHSGYIKSRKHPEFDLYIYNYTAMTQFENMWNKATMQCRGLIADGSDNIVARPFSKFFNYGQSGCPEICLDTYCQVTDKMDGSLGILYTTPEGYAIATRGSFDSDQAVWATEKLRNSYGSFQPDTTRNTYLFEIIYPENRIVLDYGKTEDLYLLGVNHITSNMFFFNTDTHWFGPRPKIIDANTFSDVCQLPPRQNAEGIVILTSGNDLIKIKQDDYKALHKLICGMNERVVWEKLVAGETSSQICEPIPDEFHEWVKSVCEKLIGQYITIRNIVRREFLEISTGLLDRKEFASMACKSPNKPYLFAMLDNKDYKSMIWKSIKPSGESKLKYLSEDVA